MTTLQIMQQAKDCCSQLSTISTLQKNRALLSMADHLEANQETILAENAKDLERAKGQISEVMLDRLALSAERIRGMAEGIRQVAELPDPVGKVLRHVSRPNGMSIDRVSVPLGVVAIIYESRPNVTSDAAALALKSGNACILRGGKEAFCSANAIVQALQEGLSAVELDPNLIQLVQDTTRQSAMDLMTGVGYIDLLIPRGGKGLISSCVANAKVPCIQTGTGICHIYIDQYADLDMAMNIVENAKTSRPSVCNAEEVCIVHRDVAAQFLPMLKQRLVDEREQKVELRLDEIAQKIIPGTPAGPEDFDTEFLDYILAVKVVDSLEDAVTHISKHSTGHSDGIVTADPVRADLFAAVVDSSSVYINASTRFTDGGEFGLGCEMGISTQKLHARGPMGLEELTTYKYVIRGNGQIR